MLDIQFAHYQKYEIPFGYTLRLCNYNNVGYALMVVEEDSPELFRLLAEDMTLLYKLLVTFDTPEHFYKVSFLHKDRKLQYGPVRNTITIDQVCFTSIDVLTAIEMRYEWEKLVDEKKSQEKTPKENKTSETK